VTAAATWALPQQQQQQHLHHHHYHHHHHQDHQWHDHQQRRHASGWAFWRRPQPGAAGGDSQHAGAVMLETSDAFPGSPPLPDAASSAPPLMATPTGLDPSATPFPPDSTDAAAAIGQACDAIEQASIAAAQADMYLTTSLFTDAFLYAHSAGLPW
jgi:hypothetical protein